MRCALAQSAFAMVLMPLSDASLFARFVKLVAMPPFASLMSSPTITPTVKSNSRPVKCARSLLGGSSRHQSPRCRRVEIPALCEVVGNHNVVRVRVGLALLGPLPAVTSDNARLVVGRVALSDRDERIRRIIEDAEVVVEVDNLLLDGRISSKSSSQSM